MSLNQILHRFVWNGLAAAVFAAPVLVGSVHWPVWMSLAGIAGALLVAYSLLMFRRGYRLRFDGFAVAMLALVLVMLFQLLPLGEGLLSMLSPAAAASVARARELGWDVPCRISLAPVATVEAACMAAMALCFYLVSFNLAYRDTMGPRILAVVGLSGAFVAAVTLLQSVSGTKAVLGLYTPEQGLPKGISFFSTFVNNNNGAGFLNLAVLVLAGQWQKAQFGRNKGVYAMLVGLTGAAALLMLSRGGMVALLVAGAMLVLFSRWAGGPRKSSGTGVLTAVGLAATAVCAVAFLAGYTTFLGGTKDSTVVRFVQENVKTEVWDKASGAVAAYKTSGAGAGSFAQAFSPFNDFAPGLSFPHAENEFLEPLVEFGLPVGAALLLALVVLFWRRFPFARSDGYYAGAFAGVMAVGLQSLADFPFRIPGLLIPVAAVLGAISGAYAADMAKQGRWWFRIGGLKLLPLAGITFLLLVLGGAWVHENSLERAQTALAVPLGARQQPGTAQEPDEGQKALEARVASLHPAESHVFTLLGTRREVAGLHSDAEALYLRARELCPGCPAPQSGLARVYLRSGREAEAMEVLLEMAEELPVRRRAVYRAIHASGVSEGVVVGAWKRNPGLLLDMVSFLAEVGAYDRTERLVQECIRTLGYDVRLLSVLGELYLKAGKPEAADLVATYLMGMYPENGSGYLIQARVAVRQGNLTDALLMYEEARRAAGTEDVELDLEFMGLLARTRNWDRFEALAAEVRPDLGRDPHWRARFHQLMAVREEMRGNHFAALAELDQAESDEPFNMRIALDKANLQLKLGRADRAAAEYRKALKIDPRSTEAAEGLRNLETTRLAPEELR